MIIQFVKLKKLYSQLNNHLSSYRKYRGNIMNIAEQKLDLFRHIDELPEESLIELKKIILNLRFNKQTDSKPNLINDMSVEGFRILQTEALRDLWQEGIQSGDSKPLDMQAIKEEALRRYREVN
jgi:hypothetical protein